MSFPSEPSVLSKLLTTLAASEAERPMLVRADGSVLMSRDFLAAVKAWQIRLEALPDNAAGKRPSVVVLSEDCGDFLAFVFGAWSAGITTVLAGDALSGTFERLAQTGMLCPGDACALEAADRLCEADARRLGLIKLEKPDARAAEPLAFAPLSDKAPLAAMLTSGSTGTPKIVAKPLGELFYEAQNLTRAFADQGLRFCAAEPVVVCGTVTQQHIYGILFRALMPLTAPGLLADAPREHFPEAIAARLAMHAAAGRRVIMVSSPAHLSRLDDPALFAVGRQAVVACASSGGPLDEAGARRCRNAFGSFPLEVLGSTETGGMARRVRRFADEACDRVETPDWRPMPGVVISAAPDPEDAENVLVGRIRIEAEHMAGAEPLVGDDRIALLSDGRFRLLGRADRIVKIEGKRASLPEIESQLLMIDGISQAKCFVQKREGADDGIGRAAELCAVLVPEAALKAKIFAEGKNAVLKAIRSALGAQLPAVLLPKRWRFVDRLPVNAAGKSPQPLLEKLFSSERPEWLIESDVMNDKGEREIALRMRLMPSLAWFQGHFPGLPILPGVAQLLLAQRALIWATELERDAQAFMQAVGVKNLKFKAITDPGMTVRLALTVLPAKPESPSRDVRFAWMRLAKNEAPAVQSQGTLVFERPEKNKTNLPQQSR